MIRKIWLPLGLAILVIEIVVAYLVWFPGYLPTWKVEIANNEYCYSTSELHIYVYPGTRCPLRYDVEIAVDEFVEPFPLPDHFRNLFKYTQVIFTNDHFGLTGDSVIVGLYFTDDENIYLYYYPGWQRFLKHELTHKILHKTNAHSNADPCHSNSLWSVTDPMQEKTCEAEDRVDNKPGGDTDGE